ncbi:hypothetical protein [Mesorhizobium ventifaucium]|uniref:Uncharacterized protein n=1 Tax=Mesorhizobium ventifaucium TaxID=666020 RepID=A0ABM9DR69_9HYPH|nr:hypothetical protein [Mesorhizobium ventifaucium]CAH2399164.1 conserved hypothetical protein [Mesorhizobium ventifaucium]
MTGPLSTASRQLEELVDVTADWSVDLIRRAGADLADALDHAARRDIEGERDWRNLTTNGRFQS